MSTRVPGVWPHWGRVSTAGSIDAYIARTMTRCYLSWRRRKWHGERPTESLPERPDRGADGRRPRLHRGNGEEPDEPRPRHPAHSVVVAVTAVLIAVSVGGSGARRATSSSSHGGAGSAMAGTQAGAMQVPPVTCPARQPTANVPATRDATFNGLVPGTPVVASVCRYGASAREGYAQLRSSTVVRGRSLAPMVAAFNVALTSGREHGCPAPVYAPPIEVDYFGYAEGLPVQVTLSLGGPSNCRSDPKPVRNADGSIRGWPS